MRTSRHYHHRVTPASLPAFLQAERRCIHASWPYSNTIKYVNSLGRNQAGLLCIFYGASIHRTRILRRSAGSKCDHISTYPNFSHNKTKERSLHAAQNLRFTTPQWEAGHSHGQSYLLVKFFNFLAHTQLTIICSTDFHSQTFCNLKTLPLDSSSLVPPKNRVISASHFVITIPRSPTASEFR